MAYWFNNIEDMLRNVDSFSYQREVDNGISTGGYVVLAKLREPRLLIRLYGRKRVYGDRVIVATFDNKNDALDKTIMFNNYLSFFHTIEHVNSVCNKATYVNDNDYSFNHETYGKTGVIVDRNY